MTLEATLTPNEDWLVKECEMACVSSNLSRGDSKNDTLEGQKAEQHQQVYFTF